MKKTRDIRKLSLQELKDFFTEKGEKSFRAKQVSEWLWDKNAGSFAEMTNLSKATREFLKEHFVINKISVADSQFSDDKTIKVAFKLHDGHIIEGVLIPTETRMTACISSQIGCSLSCAFCATGKLDLKRNVDAAEIYDQVYHIAQLAEKHYEKPLSNIVYMGMGEPLLNYRQVIRSVDLITSEKGLNMSPKRITVSTAGIAKMMKKLADDEVKFNLALSLHAANEEKRNRIMPINEQNNLDALKEALKYFHGKTGFRITLEYIIFKDFNDGIKDAEELLRFCENIPVKVNIIEYNPIDEGGFLQADAEKVDAFAAYLEDEGIIVNVRRSRGKDIDAACGQLANKNKAVNPA